jgi:uncharacterized protein (TIGR02118 family)
MLKIFAYLTKKAGLEPEAFVDYYENHHVPLVLSMAPAPPVYKRNYVVRADELNRQQDAIDFDVVTELVFPDRVAYADWITKLSGEAIAADEERFLDRSRTRACVIGERGG